ncbi:DUF664 domain-containing protein [Actinotalea sp. JY-7876]|uniref:mycothiol transferase n=1 Tax=Actinotalea sp. JY-7876 TaxID=2758442 RepID=UPI0015F58F80|nr:DUF664 domain-containing protein [Actinotalea sp. JY-7876]
MHLDDDDLITAADRALAGIAQILESLGDDLANRAPDLPGANTPFAIATHCLGVLDHWVGRLVAGRDVARDRDAEFRAAGRVDELVARLEAARERLAEDVRGVDGTAPFALPTGRPRRDWPTTRGGAILHAVEELAQHHGQLELTRDVLLARHARP